MTDTHTSQSPSKLIIGFRRVLVILAGLFTLGAFAQFFLVGVSFFDDAARWNDHSNLGHMLGLLAYVMWIPALLGKTGARIIVATVSLLVLFMAQYAFINVDNTMAQAFHPLNGSIMLVLSFWILQRSFGLLRQGRTDAEVRRLHGVRLSDNLEGTPS